MDLHEFKRGNEVYRSKIGYPLKYVKKVQVTESKEWLDNIRIIESRLYASARTYLMCYDLEREEIIWEKRSKKVSIPVGGNNNKIYTFLDRIPSCIDADSGELIWQADNDFFLMAASVENLFCRDSLNDSETISCISQKDGKELWRMKTNGSYGGTLCENGIVVTIGADGYKTVDEKTGKVLWEVTKNSIYRKLFAQNEDYCDFISSVPLIDHHLLFKCQDGKIASINAMNGDVKWKKSIENIVKTGLAIYLKNKLYINVDNKYEDCGQILCLDSETGEIISRTNEKLTSDGCVGGLISNGYLIGGNKNQIGFYDIEKQEIVHRQKVKGKQFIGNILSNPSVYKKQLIAWDMQTKGIYFFNS